MTDDKSQRPDDKTTDTTSGTSVGADAPSGDGIEHGVLVEARNPNAAEVPYETVTSPAKVMRIGSMIRQLLEEVKSADFDEASRERLAEIYERSIVELSDALSPDLQEELHMLALPFKEGDPPSLGEIRIAKAQLVGWLEGLFHGIQATLFAQQIASRQQLEQMRGLPAGGGDPEMIDPRLVGGAGASNASLPDRPGTYL